jgi:hypothetical protein
LPAGQNPANAGSPNQPGTQMPAEANTPPPQNAHPNGSSDKKVTPKPAPKPKSDKDKKPSDSH